MFLATDRTQFTSTVLGWRQRSQIDRKINQSHVCSFLEDAYFCFIYLLIYFSNDVGNGGFNFLNINSEAGDPSVVSEVAFTLVLAPPLKLSYKPFSGRRIKDVFFKPQ